MNGYVVRRTVRADVPALVALLVDDPLGHPRISALHRGGRRPDTAAGVPDGRDAVVGTCRLIVIPGLSAGRVLMEWAIGGARRRGCGLVQVTTDRSRHDAHSFCARLGFVDSQHGLKVTP